MWHTRIFYSPYERSQVLICILHCWRLQIYKTPLPTILQQSQRTLVLLIVPPNGPSQLEIQEFLVLLHLQFVSRISGQMVATEDHNLPERKSLWRLSLTKSSSFPWTPFSSFMFPQVYENVYRARLKEVTLALHCEDDLTPCTIARMYFVIAVCLSTRTFWTRLTLL